MNRIPNYNYRRATTMDADKESRKELMDLMLEKIDTDLDTWQLECVNQKYAFIYSKDNYTLHVEKPHDGDLKYFLKENLDTINIKKSEGCTLIGNLFLSLTIPLFFLFISGWGYIPMIISQIIFSIFGANLYLKNRKIFRLLKREYKRRNREQLRQRIENINVQPIEIIEEHPMDRIAL